MQVALLVPFRFGEEVARDYAWAAVRSWYLSQHRGVRIYVGTCHPSEPWSKGLAVRRAFRRSREPVVVVADADVVVSPAALIDSVTAVLDQAAAWSQPHSIVYRLSRETTVAFAAGTLGEVRPLSNQLLERRAHQAAAGGGIIVCARDAFDAVGGIDPRFIGWGGEDISFARALGTITGPPDQGVAPMWHLWHPRQPIRRGGRASEASEELAARYMLAAGKIDEMRGLVEEHADRERV